MSEEEKRFNPTFENGGYWEYYKDIERQFDSFLGVSCYYWGIGNGNDWNAVGLRQNYNFAGNHSFSLWHVINARSRVLSYFYERKK